MFFRNLVTFIRNLFWNFQTRIHLTGVQEPAKAPFKMDPRKQNAQEPQEEPLQKPKDIIQEPRNIIRNVEPSLELTDLRYCDIYQNRISAQVLVLLHPLGSVPNHMSLKKTHSLTFISELGSHVVMATVTSKTTSYSLHSALFLPFHSQAQSKPC